MKDNLFLNHLNSLYHESDIFSDNKTTDFYSKDWSSVQHTLPKAVVFPKSKEQIIETVNLCNKYNVPFIGSGGRTGLSGGATVINNELVISFEKMNKIIDFDHTDGTVLCQPGLKTHELQDFALKNNLFYPINFSSAGSSHIGGNIATNAGGINVVKYGSTKKYVDGFEIISGNGIEYNYDKRLVKNASGPDLKDLFIGSEGIFGLFSSCRMRLIEIPDETNVAILKFSDLLKLNEIRSKILNNSVEAIEFFTDNCLRRVKKCFEINNDISGSKYYIITEYSDKKIHNVFEELYDDKLVDDILVSKNMTEKEEMWKNRMFISESINHIKPLKFDLAVSIQNYTQLIQSLEKLIKNFDDIELVQFGHIGDGNLHVNFVSDSESHLQKNNIEAINKSIIKIIKKNKGTISAEHGIGYLKRDLFEMFASKEHIDLLKKIKKFYDPNNLLNPGKLIF